MQRIDWTSLFIHALLLLGCRCVIMGVKLKKGAPDAIYIRGSLTASRQSLWRGADTSYPN